MRTPRLFLPLVLFLAFALIGCGGSESSPDEASANASPQSESTAQVNRTVTLKPKGNQEERLQERILAYTPMSKPGETVEVTFTDPEEPGEYGYMCTFPGHWATMRGTMSVKKSVAV